MNKKILAISFAIIFVVAFVSLKTFGQSDIITTSQIQSPNNRANRAAIAENVLENSGMSDQFSPEEAQNIFIYYGNVSGNPENEAVISVEITPKNTILAVYEPVENGYKYVGTIGEFFNVRNVEFFPITGLPNDIVIIREEANQNIGAFEDSTFVRGYLWDGTKFDHVLDFPENIVASWNTRWDKKDDPFPWKRITQITDATYSDGGNPSIHNVYEQKYLQSSVTESENIPDSSTFSPISERTMEETYKWNINWRRFILDEATENATGKKVAVLEDFGTSPYALLPDYGENANKVRILRDDGTTDIVLKNALSGYTGNT